MEAEAAEAETQEQDKEQQFPFLEIVAVLALLLLFLRRSFYIRLTIIAIVAVVSIVALIGPSPAKPVAPMITAFLYLSDVSVSTDGALEVRPLFARCLLRSRLASELHTSFGSPD